MPIVRAGAYPGISWGGGQFGSRGKSLWARSAQSEGAKRPSNCRGVRGYPPPGNFEKMRLFKTILSIPGVILEVFFRPQYFWKKTNKWLFSHFPVWFPLPKQMIWLISYIISPKVKFFDEVIIISCNSKLRIYCSFTGLFLFLSTCISTNFFWVFFCAIEPFDRKKH